MDICANEHDPICIEERTCPLCESFDEIANLQRHIERLLDEITGLHSQIERLEKTLAESQQGEKRR